MEAAAIPTHRPCRRIDEPHRIFTHREAKQAALLQEIAAAHGKGRPVLVGTASVAESLVLAADLEAAGIPCRVLNAGNDEAEAEIIAAAGRKGAITVSTNMAGRGVDIRLGGGDPEEFRKVAAAGGLYVLGTRLHESIRIDNQLRGRAGRQGDPGSSCFFVSLEDELFHRYGLRDAVEPAILQLRREEPLTAPSIRRIVNHIQRVADGQNREIRKTLNKYSDMVEQQRRMLAERRQAVLEGREHPDLPAANVPARRRQILSQFGADTLRKAEQQALLLAIDHAWAEHLAFISFLRESIHLESIAKRNPLDEFHRQIIRAYEELPRRIEEEARLVFCTAAVTQEGLSFGESLIRPSATWTYLVNDQFFPERVSLW